MFVFGVFGVSDVATDRVAGFETGLGLIDIRCLVDARDTDPATDLPG